MGANGADGDQKLPEEQTFKAILIGAIVGVALLAVAFVALTAVKAARSPHDISSNWFVAWGTWAGGLGTAAAFLIAAASITERSANAGLRVVAEFVSQRHYYESTSENVGDKK